jgi:hypothetical protein
MTLKNTPKLFFFEQECGEILFGLTYLPTAQRLSFSIVKATNLKYNMVVDKIDEFRKFYFISTE